MTRQHSASALLWALIFVIAATWCRGIAAHAEPPASAVAATPAGDDDRHSVFAHYMVCFFSSVEFYKQEIELAQRHGVDGFALNCGAWANLDPKSKAYVPENYTLATERMYQAAQELGTGFKLFISPDLNTLGDISKIKDMVKRFYKHPNQFRHQGKPVLSGWAGGPETYAKTLGDLKQAGFEVCFVPFLYNRRYAMATSVETVERYFLGHPHVDGFFNFAADGSLADVLRSNASGRRATLLLDKVFMAGLTPAYNSANLRDWRGMQGYGTAWQGIIRDDADWVEIVTWSDYQEDSNLMPFRWPAGAEKKYFDRDESFLDATAYYSAWYKSGVQPPIAQDKLYFTYRNRSKWTRQAWDAKQKAWVDLTATPWPYDQMHDDVADAIYVDTFLTAPAQLTVEIGGKSHSLDLPAGIGHADVEIAPGVPHFTLARKGQKKPLIDVHGRKEIVGTPSKENSEFGMHLPNRTWASAAVAGTAKRFEAESGTLSGGATIVQEGATKAVANLEQPGSGFTVPITKVDTATYNVRIIYSNPGPAEARLTLSSDGPPRAAKEHPYFTPAFLPTTGKGKFATVSFLWSLYDKTTFLKLSWEPGAGNKSDPENDDHGTVLIDAIELVKVEPVQMPKRRTGLAPEMVDVPGGSFTMGGPGGEPDETPAHKVSVSPFAIGKYLVTNAEFEQFDPTHRQIRDGYSWRDREPVVYVSWMDAVHYCNWLSKQAGLTPVYEERPVPGTKQVTLEANLKAHGYRLPTEAEWEYVASGRGEGRKYPWGSDAPAAKHGNIGGRASAGADLQLASGEGGGASVVGSYPANASRDGALDLCGNVCQWCADWYHPYAAEGQKDPCDLTGGIHRIVRGGSWGYYNYSQRSADREFQNPQYPGYIYIGFRVVLPKEAK